MSTPIEIASSITGDVVLPCAALLISVLLATKLYKREREDAASDREEERQHAAAAREQERVDAMAARREERLEVRIEEMTSALSMAVAYDPRQQAPEPVIRELRRASTLLGNAVFADDPERASWLSEIRFQTERMLYAAGPYIAEYDPELLDDPAYMANPDRASCRPEHPDAKIDERYVRDLNQWSELALHFITGWQRSGQTVEMGREMAQRFFMSGRVECYVDTLRMR